MTWSYSNALTTPKDQIRLLIGDTDTSDQQLQDEEIAFFYAENTDIYTSAAACVTQLLAAYARKATSKSVGDLSLSYASRISDLKTLQADLLARASRKAPAMPYAGGIRYSDEATDNGDDDVVKTRFDIGMHDNPGTSTVRRSGNTSDTEFTRVTP